MRRAGVLAGLALLVAQATLGVSSDEFPHLDLVTSPVQTASQAAATMVEIRDQITVVELTGNYDQGFREPRAEVSREFLANHSDEYDFLVTFTTFDFDSGEAAAFATLLKNDVEGIGLPIFDQSSDFGSSGALQTYVDMKRFAGWTTDPLDPEFEAVLETLMHELQHRWGSSVRYQLPGGGVSDGLLGRAGAHWSYLLDSDASVHYGSDWVDNGDGTFTARTVKKTL